MNTLTNFKFKKLINRTAIVTGASRGIGKYIAHELAKEGMNLVLTARSIKELQEVADEINTKGGNAIFIPADVTDLSAMSKLVTEVKARFGRIDVLVNNAAIDIFSEFHDLESREIQKVIEINLLAPINLTRLIIPEMLEHQQGHVINISSMAADLPLLYTHVYNATKAGLSHFTKSLRNDYKNQGVNFSVVAPGGVGEEGMYQTVLDETNLKNPRFFRLTTPETVARAVVKALKKNKGEILVMPGPARLFSTFPRLGLTMMEKTGVMKFMKKVVDRKREKQIKSLG